jgi:hypothetical protein
MTTAHKGTLADTSIVAHSAARLADVTCNDVNG